MNLPDRMAQTAGPPHGKAFYASIVALGLLGAACSLALSQNGDASLVWRVAFAAPSVFFLAGTVQAVERLAWGERAESRSMRLRQKVRSRLLFSRFVVLAFSLGGCVAASVAAIYADAATQDFYDNLRILCFLLIFVCFCLADLAGDETFPSSMWSTAWRAVAVNIGRKPKTRRRRRSLY